MARPDERGALARRLERAFGVVLFALFFLTLPALTPARAEVDIQSVTSEKGITAWLVHDETVPIVTINFAFDGGSAQDPEGKSGLANLMTGLFDEGAGDLDSAAFQKKLDEVGAEMSFDTSRDAVYGSMRMLEEKKDAAFRLLQLAIEKPRFDQGPVDRIRAQIESNILAHSRDPEYQAQIAFTKAIYGDHPYARIEEGTKESLESVTPADLKAFHRHIFARSNLHVAVVGAIDAGSLKKVLDQVFGGLPEKPDLRPVPDVDLHLDQKIDINYDLPQSTLQLAYPGVKRKNPDFFAAYVMNHILGGGTFSSRLFEEVREKRGLAYGVSSSLITHKHAAALVIGTATRADRTDETLKIIRDVVHRLATEGPTEAELAKSKRNIIGGYAIHNLDSSRAIARTLVELQVQDLGIDYIQRREGIINAVTLEQVSQEAKKLLSADPAVLMLGPKDEEAQEPKG